MRQQYPRTAGLEPSTFNLQHSTLTVEEELRLWRARVPPWAVAELYTDPLQPLAPLDRREAERLRRAAQHDHLARGERTRERAARQRTAAWREQDRFVVRKRVWRERRDRERELLDRRDAAILERERELLAWFPLHERWLDELRRLEPTAAAWCDEQARLREEWGLTPALLDELQHRRREAAERWATDVLARRDGWERLCTSLPKATGDLGAVAAAVTPRLAELVESGVVALPLLPVVVAAVALEITRAGCTGGGGSSWDPACVRRAAVQET